MSTPAFAGQLSAINTRIKSIINSNPSSFLQRAVTLCNTYGPHRIFKYQNDFFTNDAKWFMGDFMQTTTSLYKKCFSVIQGQSIRVALSWLDDPGDILYNDLDLMVAYQSVSIWGNHGKTSDTKNTNEIVQIDAFESNTVIRITVNDYGLQQRFALAVSSNKHLIEANCDQACTASDTPLECDFGAFGTGYYLCKQDGSGYETTCTFHACDVGYIFQSNHSCIEYSVPVTKVVVRDNGKYVNNVELKECQERCYIPIGQTLCVCPVGVSNDSPPPQTSSGSQPQWIGVVGFLLYIHNIII